MKWLNGYRIRFVLFAFVAAIVLGGGGSANADFAFGTPVNLKTVIPVLDPMHTDLGCFSYDGLEMYVVSDRPGGYGGYDVWVLKRTSAEGDWGPPENLGPAVNSPSYEYPCSVSADGLTLYFQSDRPGGYGFVDFYVTTRATKDDSWGPAVNLGPKLSSYSYDYQPQISGNGLEFYFASARSGGYGIFDIYVSRRATTNDPWGDPVNLGPPVNSKYCEGHLSLSADGLLLFFSDDSYNPPVRPGGYGLCDIWMTRRASLSDPWQTPVNLGPQVNGPADEMAHYISRDGRTLYFFISSLNGSTWDSWQAPIIPIVDFNGDEIVDINDLVIFIEHWGTSDSLCDIGPMPWGNGVVDKEDLEVLMSYWGQEFKFLPFDLRAYWKLDETEGTIAKDSVSDKDGTLHGNPIWQPEGGKVNGALQLDGVDDYISTPFVLNPADGEFSVFAWLKGGAPVQVIISQTGGANWLSADPSAGKLMTNLAPPAGRFTPPPLMSESVITDGIWHRIGFVWNGSNRILYVDDLEVARDTQSGLAGSIGGLHIGAGKGLEAVSFWSGLIDDVRIYDRAVKP